MTRHNHNKNKRYTEIHWKVVQTTKHFLWFFFVFCVFVSLSKCVGFNWIFFFQFTLSISVYKQDFFFYCFMFSLPPRLSSALICSSSATKVLISATIYFWCVLDARTGRDDVSIETDVLMLCVAHSIHDRRRHRIATRWNQHRNVDIGERFFFFCLSCLFMCAQNMKVDKTNECVARSIIRKNWDGKQTAE